MRWGQQKGLVGVAWGKIGGVADIQFDEPQYGQSTSRQRYSWLTGLVIKTGLASDDAGVQKVLLIVLGLAIVGIALVLVVGGGATRNIPPPPVPPLV
ncbi:MAG: hypothetical protein Q8P36_01110 [bacterium]|nr:hypothetical protein [bacterium]